MSSRFVPPMIADYLRCRFEAINMTKLSSRSWQLSPFSWSQIPGNGQAISFQKNTFTSRANSDNANLGSLCTTQTFQDDRQHPAHTVYHCPAGPTSLQRSNCYAQFSTSAHYNGLLANCPVDYAAFDTRRIYFCKFNSFPSVVFCLVRLSSSTTFPYTFSICHMQNSRVRAGLHSFVQRQ